MSSLKREDVDPQGTQEWIESLEDEIEDHTRMKVESKYLTLDAILIRDVTLPLTLRNGIEKKER